MDLLPYNIKIAIDLSTYDEKVRKYCEDNPHDTPDYTTLIQRISEDLEQLDGVQQAIFDHMSWIEVDLGTDNFSRAATETNTVISEIIEVFEKHGVK